MKFNSRGFSAFEALILILVAAVLGLAGWLVYDRQNTKSPDEVNTESTTIEPAKEEAAKLYNFDQLGISMRILEGWQVKTSHTKSEEGVNLYEWTIEKDNADGKIEIRSDRFLGGFMGCSDIPEAGIKGELDRVNIRQIEPTNNPKFMFISWSFDYDNKTTNYNSIVPASEEIFWRNNDQKETKIANKDLKPGEYFYCPGLPGPGFNLGLNSESVGDNYMRRETISAVSTSTSNNDAYSFNSQSTSYQDIKTMLLSIK